MTLGSEHKTIEIYYYDGLVRLYRAVDETDSKARRVMLDGAIASFREATRGPQIQISDGLPMLYLVASQVLAQQYRSAIDQADAFLIGYPTTSEGRARLNHEIQTQIVLVSALRSLASFLGNQGVPLTIESNCTIRLVAVGEVEARLLGRLFESVLSDRDDRTLDGLKSYEIGLYCADMIGLIREAWYSDNGCLPSTPGSHAPQQIMRQYDIRVPKSRNRDLGFAVNGKLSLRLVNYVEETRLVERTVNGRVVTEEVTVEIPIIEQVEYDSNEEIPENRYLPRNTAGRYFPNYLSEAGSAPVKADNAPAPAAEAPAPPAEEASPDAA